MEYNRTIPMTETRLPVYCQNDKPCTDVPGGFQEKKRDSA